MGMSTLISGKNGDSAEGLERHRWKDTGCCLSWMAQPAKLKLGARLSTATTSPPFSPCNYMAASISLRKGRSAYLRQAQHQYYGAASGCT